MTARPRTSEAIQSACFWEWVQSCAPLYPALRLVAHVANEGRRAPWKARQMGIATGFPDVVCFARRGGYNGWARELKVYPNKPTSEQLGWIAALRSEGWDTGVLTMREPGDWAMVARELSAYLGLPDGVAP